MAKNLEPGMDDPQAEADRKGWQTTVNMLTGAGERKDFTAGAGPEVGNNYDADPLGEEYGAVTYNTADGAGTSGGGPSAQMPRTDQSGKTTASAPQNYNTVAK